MILGEKAELAKDQKLGLERGSWVDDIL